MENYPDSLSSTNDSTSYTPLESNFVSSETLPDPPQMGGGTFPSGEAKRLTCERKTYSYSVTEAILARTRRSRLQRQPEFQGAQEAQDKGSLTPSMRKKYLKDLFLNYKSHTGLSSILSFKSVSQWSRDGEDAGGYSLEDPSSGAFWALDPMEHAWMMSVVDGNYDTMMEFLSEDPTLLTRRDFVSGYTALHWMAKNGKHETLIKLLKRAEKEGSPANVNLKGSGGLTPLHVAAMHNQYMVVKILVGAFGANIDAMDYNGKRAWQYLRENAPPEMKELLGAWDDEHRHWQLNVNNNSAGTLVPLVQELPKSTDEMDSVNRSGSRWRFGSFRKLLSPFFAGGKK